MFYNTPRKKSAQLVKNGYKITAQGVVEALDTKERQPKQHPK
jgi:hypothetical protein